jgi:hypothetical protein
MSMSIVRRARVIAGALLTCTLVGAALAAPAGAGTASSADAPQRFLLDDAPAFAFPGATRGEPIAIDQLVASPGKDGFQLTLTPLAPPDATAPITTRVAFFPQTGNPWALEWKTNDTKATVVTPDRKGSAGTGTDALPTWKPTKFRRPLVLDGDVVHVALPVTFLHTAKVALPELSGVQVIHQQVRSDGSIVNQGSPLVEWGALLSPTAPSVLPPVGVAYDADGHSQPWNVVPTCSACAKPPVVTIRDDYLEGREQEVENTSDAKSGTIVVGPGVDLAGYVFDQVRYFADDDPLVGSDAATTLQQYNGAICVFTTMMCDFITGNNHDAQVTGQGSFVTGVDGRKIDFTITGDAAIASSIRGQYSVLVKSSADATTSVATWTPWALAMPPRGLVTPDAARGWYLTAKAAKKVGLQVDESKLSTITDANQLPTSQQTRDTYNANGFLAEHLNFYTTPGVDANNPSGAPPGTTAFFSQSVDVFNDANGAQAVLAYLNDQVANGTGLTVVQKGNGSTPEIIQRTDNGLTSTTAYWTGAPNGIVVLRSACNQCQPGDALKTFQRTLSTVRKKARAANAD